MGGTFHPCLPEKQKQPRSMHAEGFLLPCFPSSAFLLPSLNRSTLCHAPLFSPISPLPYMPCPLQPPTYPSSSLLHKLPVIDPGPIVVVFPMCPWEPQHPGPALNEAPTKGHWWEAQCERGWPQPTAPRTGHQLPRALPPHKDVLCGQGPERAWGEIGRERKGKRGRRYSVQTT